MEKSKFIRLLQTLDKRELRAFDQYLKNLYPGKKVQHQLFDFIKSFRPAFRNPKLNHQEVLRDVFQEQSEGSKKITDALSDLYLLLMEFLMWQENKKKCTDNEIKKIRILKQRDLNVIAWQVLKKTKKELDNSPIKNEWHFLDQLFLSHDRFYSGTPISFQHEAENLKAYLENLEHFFNISKLKLIAEARSRENILGKQEFFRFLDQVNIEIKKEDRNQVLLLNIYTKLIKLLEDGKQDEYSALKVLILQRSENFSKRDFKNLLTYLINYSANKIRNGNGDFFQEVFELSKVGIEKDVLFENNHIPASRFINLIDVACQLNQIDWAITFSRGYSSYLDNSIKDKALIIADARIYFAKSVFNKVIEILSTFRSRNIYFELRARTLLLRSYVELYKNKEHEFILNQCDAFEQYLKRNNKLSEKVLNAYHNFIKIIRHLVSRKKSSFALLKIKNKMTELVCRNWINTQLKKYEPAK